MVYKPRKTVNGHKRNDRATRRRKARDARKRRAAARPVRSNIKRYVAEQFGKTHPDNRFYYTPSKKDGAVQVYKPTNNLSDTPRYYPFGATFQNAFLTMEFQRMKEVVSQPPGIVPLTGGHVPQDLLDSQKKIGDYNHWRSVLGRGIHMKSSSVYGTITLNELIPLKMQHILKYGNLRLHMFVLEDKAVTKSEFLNWYKDFLKTSFSASTGAGPIDADPSDGALLSEQARDITSSDGPVDNGCYDKDLINVPYVAGSMYPGTGNDDSGKHYVAGEKGASASTRAKGGHDEFLLDWSKFYKTDVVNDNGVTTLDYGNPLHSLFYNEVKCTTSWDGSRANSNLPVNKSRFIVHEHKTWSFKPRANGCVDTVIPFEYSFPEHYMHYDKELLDMPFVWNSRTDSTDKDDRGLHHSWLYPRKQPYIVFVYTCDNPHMIEGDTHMQILNYSDITTQVQNVGGVVRVHDGNNPSDLPSSAVDSSIAPNYPDVTMTDEQVSGNLHARETGSHPWGYQSSNHTTSIPKGEVFSIDMHFKCTYENKLATSIVPTIHKGRPIIHKRESAPKPRTSRKRARDPAPEPRLKKQRTSRKRPQPPASPPRLKKQRASKKRSRIAPSTPPGKRTRPPSIVPSTSKLDDYLLRHPAARAGRHASIYDPTRAKDDVGLDKAYASNDGTFIDGDTMYIAGTGAKGSSGGHIGDIFLRWHLIAEGRTSETERYRQVMRRLLTVRGRRVKYLVGHSYGGAVADRITRDNEDFTARLYGAARFGQYHPRILSFRHEWDPVSIIDFDSYTDKNTDRTAPIPAHGYHGYSWMNKRPKH